MINKVMITGTIKLVRQGCHDKSSFLILTIKEVEYKNDVAELLEKDLPVIFKSFHFNWKVGDSVYVEGRLVSRTYFDEITKKNREKIVILAEQIRIFDVESLDIITRVKRERYFAEVKYDFDFDLN